MFSICTQHTQPVLSTSRQKDTVIKCTFVGLSLGVLSQAHGHPSTENRQPVSDEGVKAVIVALPLHCRLRTIFWESSTVPDA